MPTGTYGVTLSVGGVSIQKSVTRTADGVIGVEAAVAAGKTGTLTTRTDDNTGIATMTTGHGLVSTDVCDIYWSGGMRYGMVATVSGDAVTLDGGSGTVLPSTSTAVVVQKQIQVNVTVDGDALEILGVSLEYTDPSSTAVGHVDFQDTDDDSIEAVDLVANVPQVWDIEGGASNVFTGDVITKALVTNGSSSAAAVIKIVGLQDVTP